MECASTFHASSTPCVPDKEQGQGLMHILITGGAGFIGSHLVDLHLKRGDKVHVVDDLSTGSYANIAAHEDDPSFRFDEADVLTWDKIERVVGWADRIYHLAAVVGVAILQLIGLLPWVGGVVVLLAGLLGAGAIVAMAWRRFRAPGQPVARPLLDPQI